MLNRHDKTLLDKQLWGVNPTPPSLIGLAMVAVFFGGLVIGSVMFSHERKQTREISGDITGSIPAHMSRTKWPVLSTYSRGALAP
jgi:hypothetical protein